MTRFSLAGSNEKGERPCLLPTAPCLHICKFTAHK